MCGIIGYTGASPALSMVIDSLRKLEYRGYDSAGIALTGKAGEKLIVAKRAGKLSNLESALTSDHADSLSGIGHTRWATHGGPTDENAHPHISSDGKVAVIHNGIIENYLELKVELEKRGHKFASQTDTESVAHLLSDEFNLSKDLADAMRKVCKRLRGSFTLLAISSDSPEVIVGARRNSPLVVGLGKGENFLASDVSAFIAHTKSALELGQDQVVQVSPDSVLVTDLDGKQVSAKPFEITWDAKAAERGGYTHFMLKEIFEQPKAISETLLGRFSDDSKVICSELSSLNLDIDRILILACGTAYHAGLIGKYAIEQWSKIAVDVELASEFRYRKPFLTPKTLVITISQSGETMDTLMAARHAKDLGAATLSICNTMGSSIARESDAVFYTHAGPEIAVASTKALLTQIVALKVIALYLAQNNKSLSGAQIAAIISELLALPNKVEEILETVEPLREMTRGFKDATSVLFLGRNVGYPAALEGALKLKELAYMHAEGFAGGELKHGPIALIEEGTPVIAILPPASSPIAEKMLSNIQEVRARGANVIAIADSSISLDVKNIIRIPSCDELLQSILAIVPLQVFAYEMAVARGNDVDQPRNLAKSVTVE
ncbi:MAG TPA: glutamine--fructose-6-phosphate transaminase (isomerizing) [Candidatus Nanopelagicaceae bacterium]|jgi:glucosamine--fructose-6-phosphate aminotransferase (isomerizing)|nr:glutamine--fructose-6-phosphate transaminase (isomerizing) [Candidatus Nanopelagicaceae bacterium]